MFDRSAHLYDAVYDALGKDYEAEAEAVLDHIRAVRASAPARLLDVACGTGRHLEVFSRTAECVGIDLEPTLLAVAARRCPGVDLVQADMTGFDLGRSFDAVTCLFSSIAYASTVEALRRAVRCMRAHLAPDGVLVVEPWFGPARWAGEHVQVVHVDEAGMTAVRMMRSSLERGMSVLDAHYLLGRPDAGIEHFTERHELGLFGPEECAAAFEAEGLTPSFDPHGLTGRGLVIGTRSSS